MKVTSALLVLCTLRNKAFKKAKCVVVLTDHNFQKSVQFDTFRILDYSLSAMNMCARILSTEREIAKIKKSREIISFQQRKIKTFSFLLLAIL